jgi:PKD repeat protein
MKVPAICCVVLLIACEPVPDQVQNEHEAQIVTDFNFGLASGDCKNENYEVNFQNQSTATDSVHWDLGDGITTSELNPGNIYEQPGDYVITLTAYRNGISSQVIKTIVVPHRNTGPSGSLAYRRIDENDLTFEFTIETEASGYFVYFGDGSRTYQKSSVKTLKHTYSSAGSFKVLLALADDQNQFASCYSTVIDLNPGGM